MSKNQIISIASDRTMSEIRKWYREYIELRVSLHGESARAEIQRRHPFPRIPFGAVVVVEGVARELSLRISYKEEDGLPVLNMVIDDEDLSQDVKQAWSGDVGKKLISLVQAWITEQKLAGTWD